MIAVQILLIAVGALLADADECSCSCNEQDVCEEQNTLRMDHDENTAEIEKWNQHYDFVRGFVKDWRDQVAQDARRQLEVRMNETLEGSKNTSQKEELIARIESLENSMRAIQGRANELDWTMNVLSGEMNGIRTESRRIQHGPKCGVDFNNDGSNEGGNTDSVLVWPWMAAVYSNSDSELDCGGSVIHPHFVLTSAECAEYYRSARLSVKLGLSDLKNRTHLQEYIVQSTHFHPQFKTGSGDNFDYGIALLELEEAIPFGHFVRPVCLPPREIPQGDTTYKPRSAAQAVRLNEYLSSPLTDSPTVFNLTILPQKECRRVKKENEWKKIFPSPNLSFCGESSSTTCPYIGSPVMESRLEGDGTRTWTQVGISTCTGKYIFSPRLDHLRAWVDATIAASSKGINIPFPGRIRNTEAQGELPTSKKPSLAENVNGCSDDFEEGACFSHEGGYLALYDEFNVGSKININFDIKPRNLSGILMAVHGKRDYLILQMVDGRFVVSVDNGVGPIRTVYEPQSSHFLCDGQWHTVHVWKNGNIVSLAVDGDFQDPGIGDGGVKSTDTKDPLYIGGVPESSLSKSGVETREQFVGCIRFLELNQTPQSLSQSRVTGLVTLYTCPTI